jgi:single-stranded-DNA-specific exonuclease
VSKSINLLNPAVISQSTTSSDIIKILLKNRQIIDVDEFLKPSFPKLKLNLSPAVKIINHSITTNQHILIYGDYDVDGITATAILWQALYKRTKNVTPFIPHREKDGYGIKAE